GVAGFAAAEMAKAMGASVAVSEIDRERAEQILRAGMDRVDGGDDEALDRKLIEADVVIGAVYVKGKAPVILKEDRLKRLSQARHGRPLLIIDIAVDQGGNVEFIRRGADGVTRVSHDKTSHLEPIAEDAFGNMLVRIPNMPAAVPRQASLDLERATLPYLRALSFGLDRAMRELPELAGGLSIRLGRILDRRVAEAHPSL